MNLLVFLRIFFLFSSLLVDLQTEDSSTVQYLLSNTSWVLADYFKKLWHKELIKTIVWHVFNWCNKNRKRRHWHRIHANQVFLYISVIFFKNGWKKRLFKSVETFRDYTTEKSKHLLLLPFLSKVIPYVLKYHLNRVLSYLSLSIKTSVVLWQQILFKREEPRLSSWLGTALEY